MAGITLFSGASLICGVSQSEIELLVARGFQGLGGAMVSPAALSIILTTFAEGQARNRALSVWGAIAGAGGAVGLLLGGVLVQALSWRWSRSSICALAVEALDLRGAHVRGGEVGNDERVRVGRCELAAEHHL